MADNKNIFSRISKGWILFGIGLILFLPIITKFAKKLKAFIDKSLGMINGEGNLSTQQVTEVDTKVSNEIKKIGNDRQVIPTINDLSDAAQIAKWNNTYRGFFQSMYSTNVPRSEQIKVFNLLGIAVISDGKVHHKDGSTLKITDAWPMQMAEAYVQILNEASFVSNINRWLGIMIAYGEKSLSDRQRFLIGYFLDNSTASLIGHIKEFYSNYFIANYLPLLQRAVLKKL